MHDQWRLHEEQLKQSTSQIQGQLESLHMDAGNKGQKIGELQRESMTFKSMVEESNKVVTQLKVVSLISGRLLVNFNHFRILPIIKLVICLEQP